MLAAVDERIGEDARAGHVDRLVGLERHPQHERLDMPAAELVPDDIPGRQHTPPLPQTATRMRRQHCVQGRTEADRSELRSAEDRFHVVVFVEEPLVGRRVRRAEPGDLRRGPVPVKPHGELLPVRERDVGDRVGVKVAQPVVRHQPKLVPGKQRVDPDQRVAGSACVDAVPGQQDLLGGGATARYVPSVEDEAPVSGLGQVTGGDQAVVPGACHYDIRVHPPALLPGPPHDSR